MARPLNVLVLGCLTKATGNAVTTQRIAAHLAHQHQVTLVDTCEVSRLDELTELVRHQRVDAAIGVHALLAGPLLSRLPVPYGLVFGGTDLYEPAHDLHQSQMDRAVRGAQGLVAFSEANLERARMMWSRIDGRARLIPQASELTEATSFSVRRQLGLSASDFVLLLPAGLRRVKDPSFLFDAIAQWHRTDPRVHGVVVGDALEPDHADEVLARIAVEPSLHHLPTLDRADLLGAMKDADLVLNTSVSEGMCGVLLEAMQVGTPILARRNAGNASLISSGDTGFLFDSPLEFLQQARAVLGSAPLRSWLTSRAKSKVNGEHGLQRERAAYLGWFEQLFGQLEQRAAVA